MAEAINYKRVLKNLSVVKPFLRRSSSYGGDAVRAVAQVVQ